MDSAYVQEMERKEISLISILKFCNYLNFEFYFLIYGEKQNQDLFNQTILSVNILLI